MTKMKADMNDESRSNNHRFCLQYINVRSGEKSFFVSVRPGSLGPIFLARDFSLQFSMNISDINLRKGPQ